MQFKRELAEKVLRGEKTVTRRPVKFETLTTVDLSAMQAPRPCRYKVGHTYAVQPTIESGPGKGRGGKAIGRIRILSVRREPLGHRLPDAEVRREGFETWEAMVIYWWELHTNWLPEQLVDRIEFEAVSDRD